MSVVIVNGTENSELGADKNIIQDELSVDKLYEIFSLQASDLLEIMDTFQALKRKLDVEKLYGLELYRELKTKLGARNSKTWKAREVLNMLDKRANQKEYMEQKAASGIRVLIVGAGPVGLRLAIDCSLLGAEVVIIEKRETFSRNNVLHLWPFTIEDLKQLGAKKFYGKFCAGAIDHISIRSLQCILLKLCLLLGVKIYHGVEFLEILEPNEQIGWHASVEPEDHPVSQFEFDFIVGAEGARKSRMPGFDRKELRGKLALAITANFKNYYSREEAAVEEISGVAFIFNQKFFKDLKADTDIDLENIVYYKDDTHYFVMTAKKDSLYRKGVLKKDYSETARLLSRDNIDEGSLWDYAIEAAAWSTELPKLDFAFNHHKKPDVALFDFTSIHQAEYAARAIRRGGKDLFLCLIGDALLEPFWPTGTGCARGFLGAMDTAWMIRGAGQGKKVLDLLSERECIFQRLPQTTPEKLQQNIKSYTIDPQSRYPNLHFHRVRPSSVQHLYSSDDFSPSPALRPGSVRVKRTSGIAGGQGLCENETSVTQGNVNEPLSPTEDNKENFTSATESREMRSITSPSRKPLMEKGEVHRAYYVNIDDDSLHTLRDHRALIKWLQQQVQPYDIEVTNLSSSWSSGMALCALIHRYRPDLIPNFSELNPENSVKNNQLAFSLAEEHLAISSLIKPTEMKKPDKLALFTYLSLFYELFEDAEPVELTPPTLAKSTRELSPLREEASDEQLLTSGEVTSSPEKSLTSPKKKKSRKKSKLAKRATKKSLATSPSSVERSWSSKRPNYVPPTSPPGKTATPSLPTNKESKAPASDSTTAQTTPKRRPLSSSGGSQFKVSAPDSSDFCYFCGKRVYLMERMSANGLFFHRNCFKCSHCNCKLKMGNYSLSKGEGGEKGKFFCSVHYRQLFMSNPEAINYSRADAPKRQTNKPDVKEVTIQQKSSDREPDTTETKALNIEKDTIQRDVSPEQIHITTEEVNEEDEELPSVEVELTSDDTHLQTNGEIRTNSTEPFSDDYLEPTGDYLEDKETLEDTIADDTYQHRSDASVVSDQTPEEQYQQEDDEIFEEVTENLETTGEEPYLQSGDEDEKVNDNITINKEVTPQMSEPEQLTGITDVMVETAEQHPTLTSVHLTEQQPDVVNILSETSQLEQQRIETELEVEEIPQAEQQASTATDLTIETSQLATCEDSLTKPPQTTSMADLIEENTSTTDLLTETETPSQGRRATPKPARKAPPPPLNKQNSDSPKERKTTPKPARKAPLPPLQTQLSGENHVTINSTERDLVRRSSSKSSSSPKTPTSPLYKTRSSSDPRHLSESSEPRSISRSSRSRSASLEIDENVHRVLEQQGENPAVNSDEIIYVSSSSPQMNSKSTTNTHVSGTEKSPTSVRCTPVRPAPYRPSSGRKASGNPSPVLPASHRQSSVRKTSGSQAPIRPAPYRPPSCRKTSAPARPSPPSNHKASGSSGPAHPSPPSSRKASGSPAPVRPAPPSNRKASGNPAPVRPAPPSVRKTSGSPVPVRQAPRHPPADRQPPDRPAPYSNGAGFSPGIVKRLSMGFEKLEANAKETEIQLGVKAREIAKANLHKAPSSHELPPYQQLDVISEDNQNPANLQRPVSPSSFKRPRSPCEWKGTLGRSRKPPDEVYHIPRSSQTASVTSRYVWSRRPKRGQRSVTRSLSSYSSSDVAIQERRKQQRRFREAQLIQREMSQLERQYDELEEVGRDIENALRESEDSVQEDQLMKSWLGLVNERNGLVRKTAELSLKMKELELEDKQYEVDQELAELCQVSHHEMTKAEQKRFEELCELKLKVVEERNEIVMQTEEERVRELEEDVTTNTMLDKQFGANDGEETSSDEDEQQLRDQQQQYRNDHSRKNSIENGSPSKLEKRKSSRLSGLLSLFSSK